MIVFLAWFFGGQQRAARRLLEAAKNEKRRKSRRGEKSVQRSTGAIRTGDQYHARRARNERVLNENERRAEHRMMTRSRLR